MIQTIGLKWDRYTPAVEGQILRDIMALQAASGNRPLELHVASKPEAYRAITGVGAVPNAVEELATIWIIYRTTKAPFKEAPEGIEEDNIILRDMYAPTVNFGISTEVDRGYYLKPEGRTISNQMNNLIMPAPGGVTNPMLIMLWGSAAKRKSKRAI